MAEYDLTQGGASGYPFQNRKQYVISRELDCSVQNLAQNDVANLLNIPAGSFVHGVRWEVLTAEGGAATGEIGDGDDVDGWSNATTVDVNDDTVDAMTALTLTDGTPNVVSGYTAGKFYPAAGTIDFKAGAALDTAKIKVSALITDMG